MKRNRRLTCKLRLLTECLQKKNGLRKETLNKFKLFKLLQTHLLFHCVSVVVRIQSAFQTVLNRRLYCAPAVKRWRRFSARGQQYSVSEQSTRDTRSYCNGLNTFIWKGESLRMFPIYYLVCDTGKQMTEMCC